MLRIGGITLAKGTSLSSARSLLMPVGKMIGFDQRMTPAKVLHDMLGTDVLDRN